MSLEERWAEKGRDWVDTKDVPETLELFTKLEVKQITVKRIGYRAMETLKNQGMVDMIETYGGGLKDMFDSSDAALKASGKTKAQIIHEAEENPVKSALNAFSLWKTIRLGLVALDGMVVHQSDFEFFERVADRESAVWIQEKILRFNGEIPETPEETVNASGPSTAR